MVLSASLGVATAHATSPQAFELVSWLIEELVCDV